MLTIRRVICPIDFSEPSQRALRHAVALARWHDAELTALHVEDALSTAARTEMSGYAISVSNEDSLRACADIAGAGDDVRVIVAHGQPVTEIVEHARRRGDLIVIGTRGRTGLSRLVLGSVAEGVVTQASCPVMTIPPAAASVGGELDRYDPVLVASDFSPSCATALGLAISMAQEADARLLLLHAIQYPAVPPSPWSFDGAFDRRELRAHAVGRLRRGLPGDAVFRCRPETVVVDGSPADAILQVAEDQAAQLIVMGTQSRGAIDRMLFGSTTRRVIQSAQCPVLSIRADQAAEPWVEYPEAQRRIEVDDQHSRRLCALKKGS